MGWIWIQKSHSARTVGSGDIPLSHVEFKVPDTLNTMVYIKQSTTIISYSVRRLISKLTLQDSKISKENYVCTLSNVWTAKSIIKLTQIYVHSGNINFIENSIPKSIKSFVIVEDNRFAQPWAAYKHNYEINQIIFTKCSKEQFTY